MDIDKIKEIIRRKPTFFIVLSIVYLLVIAALKWALHPSIDTILFIVGGVLGIFFLDIAEVFFNLNPSPFRGMLFFGAFIAVCFFIITSSGSALASGLVLSLYLTMLMWQIGQWRLTGDLTSWYSMIAAPVDRVSQQRIMIGLSAVFLLLTVLYVR